MRRGVGKHAPAATKAFRAARFYLEADYLAAYCRRTGRDAIPDWAFFIAFSMFRLVLVASFVDNQVWFAFWEETTELLFVGLVGAVLLLFQRGLSC
jgi:aminoglycoside phosphotransferase (APT) family kinase protein